MGRPEPASRRDLRGQRRPRVRAGGRLDLGEVSSTAAVISSSTSTRARVGARTGDRLGRVRGVPLRPGRGSDVLAARGAARPGGCRPVLRRGDDPRAGRSARGLRLPSRPTAPAIRSTRGTPTRARRRARWVMRRARHRRQGRHVQRHGDPGVLRGLRRRPFRERRGRVARRATTRIRIPWLTRRVRPGRVDRRQPVARLEGRDSAPTTLTSAAPAVDAIDRPAPRSSDRSAAGARGGSSRRS